MQVWPWCKFESKIAVPVRRLDTWAAEHHISRADFIWADIQGTEGDLVRGGLSTLTNTRYLYTEYSDIECHEGQPSLHQLMAMLGKFAVIRRYPMDVLLKNTTL